MSEASALTLTKEKRIRKRRDFLRVQKYGVRTFGRFVVAIMQRDNNINGGRIGITVPKKVGPAYIRNKVKRRIRHILRLNQSFFFEKLLVIVVKDSASSASFSELKTDLLDACRRLNNNKVAAFRYHSKLV